MQIWPVKRWLMVFRFKHATLRVAVDWSGVLLSGHLHQDAAEMEPSVRSFSYSMLQR
jgi:hypothetical protein